MESREERTSTRTWSWSTEHEAMDTGKPHARAGQGGLTLIELIIVAGLMALIVAIVVPSVESITGVHLKTSSSGLAGTIRYTYDLAARKSAVFRVVINLDENSYWVESASKKFLLDREEAEVRDGVLEEPEEEEPERARRFIDRGFIEGGEMWHAKKRASFSDFAGPMTPKVKLPQGIEFQDVWVDHQSDVVMAGRAYLYCFPTGMTERAVIHLIEENDDVYSVTVEALTGSVRIDPHYVEIPED